jgi:tetratricopeptide (TPR) repeat protein
MAGQPRADDFIMKQMEKSAAAPSFSSNASIESQLTSDRSLFLTLGAIVLVYALLAGLRTVADNDLGWQMATGRWVAQHHRVFSADVFSYTAYGRPWTYPVGCGLLFYFAYLLGGYALLSWIGAVACAGSVALLLRRGSLTTAVFAIIAVPLIAYRTVPRADMFTVILFAACLSLLWENFQTGRARLWLLPLLMIAWVNLHLGFLAGLALIFGFAGMELLEMLFPGTRRDDAIRRLKREVPWFGAAFVATLLNPWGWKLYQAIIRQDQAMAQHARWVTEWFGLTLNWTVIASSLSLRNPSGAVYWVLGIAAVAVVLASLQRQFGAALLLGGAAYQTIHHVRMEALTSCVVIVVGGSVLHSTISHLAVRIPNPRLRSALALSAVVLFAAFACEQSLDLVTQGRYFIRNDIWTFGAGMGWWYPQRAAEFLQREKPPGNIFNTLDEGGFLLFTLGDRYRDYIDGRAIPFGVESFQRQQSLLEASLDSPLWQQEADRYHINTFILPLNRIHITPLLRLKDFCNSRSWRPVYLDEVSAVFVRRSPETEALIKRSEVDCSNISLPVQPVSDSRGIAFNRWVNAAAVLEALDRNYEALTATDKAQQIFPGGGYVHWLRGDLFARMGRIQDAEDEFQKAVELDPSENTYTSLAMLYYHEGRIAEAALAMQRATRLSLQPYTATLHLARFYLTIADPQLALQTLDEVLRLAPAGALTEAGSDSVRFQVARSRADAYRMQGDTQRAATSAEEAVQLAPADAPAWTDLARLYALEGKTADQQRAERRAADLIAGEVAAPDKP